MVEPSTNKIKLGEWDFSPIQLEDSPLFAEYIGATEYPANLWSSNFAYLWACSQSTLRKVLWKIVDGMLVAFGHSYKNTLYLYCLPFGPGNPAKVTRVVLKCLQYCYAWNQQEGHRTTVRMLNQDQLDFLGQCPEFAQLFKLVTLQGIERHLNIQNLVSLAGKKLLNVRHRFNKFHRENPEVSIRRYQKADYAALLDLSQQWSREAGQKYSVIFDKGYYREILRHCDELRQIVLVFQKGPTVIGMVSGSELPTGQAWGSLLKYQSGIPGLSETLTVEFARELNRINPRIELLNVGSDLGPGGLRDYKLKFRPVLNLKRYQIYLQL